MASTPPRWIVAIYRRVARLSAAHVTQRFADEQVALFVDIWREERPPAILRTALWLIDLFARAVAAALGTRRDQRRRNVAGRPHQSRGRFAADLRHALRALRRAPWYAGTLTAVVALGIALAATVFALVDGILFKPLPYRAPGELFALQGRGGGEGAGGTAVSLSEIRAWQAGVPEMIVTAHSTSIGYGTLGVINGPTVWARAVDRDFWETLGVRPRFGHFQPDDYDHDQPVRPVVITDGLWHRLFGRDVDIAGRLVQTGRVSSRIVGVLPPEFVFPAGAGQVRPDILFPAVRAAGALERDTSRSYSAIARIPSHIPMPTVRERLDAVTRRLEPAPPSSTLRQQPFDAVEIVPLKTVVTARERSAAVLVFAAMSVMVLLVAVNVGGLVGSRALDRAREAAARRALGASSFDLARLQLIEVALLVVIGATAGTVAARFLLLETARRLPPDLVLLRAPIIDDRVIGVVAGAAILVAAVATLSGLRASRRASLTSLIGQGAGVATARTRSVGRTLLQAGQVALAMLLVLGGALFLTSLYHVWRVDTGYDLSDTMFIDVRVSPAPGTATAQALALLPVLRGVPGVSAAGAMDTLLLAGAYRGSTLQPPRAGIHLDPEMLPITSGFFSIAGLTATEGRLPTDAELDAGTPVAAVSDRVARTYWPGSSAIGQTLSHRRAVLTVVGVTRDSRFQGLDRISPGEIYVPMVLGLWTSPAPTYLIRSRLPERAIVPVLLEAVTRFDPGASIRRAQTVEAALSASVTRRRFHAWLFGVMAAASLLVSGAGIFGLVATATARRTREIGLRVALGSTRPQLLRLLLREQLAPVIGGLLAGGGVAAASARLVRAMLYEVSAYDAGVWAVAALVVLCVAAIGILVPASRLTRIEPITALRME